MPLETSTALWRNHVVRGDCTLSPCTSHRYPALGDMATRSHSHWQHSHYARSPWQWCMYLMEEATDLTASLPENLCLYRDSWYIHILHSLSTPTTAVVLAPLPPHPQSSTPSGSHLRSSPLLPRLPPIICRICSSIIYHWLSQSISHRPGLLLLL